ncbi:hypothetical protein A2U01_0095151, partial [Trifolium medium]|nr:hypothetical protein [Trifolium medium]
MVYKLHNVNMVAMIKLRNNFTFQFLRK